MNVLSVTYWPLRLWLLARRTNLANKSLHQTAASVFATIRLFCGGW
jgi:hypothetical protein